MHLRFKACFTFYILSNVKVLTMVISEFDVPLTPQDLPAEQTYEQIKASLSALQQASDGVFARIQDAVEDRRST